MDYFKSVHLRNLQPVVAGGLSDAEAYRRYRDANEAANHAQAVLEDA